MKRFTFINCAKLLLMLLAAEASALDCPQTISYEDIIDIAQPGGKIINNVKFTPYDKNHYIKNIPSLKKSAKLTKLGERIGNFISCIYQYGSLLSQYTLIIVGQSLEDIMVKEIEEDPNITQQQKKFIIFENFVNAAIDPMKRLNVKGQIIHPKFNLQYLKIPLDKVREFKLNLADPKIRDALIFKDGTTTYLKWPIHPEDRKYYLQIMKLLKAHGLSEQDIQPLIESTNDPRRLDGYLTASRSIFLNSPKDGIAFTLKGSTDYIGGQKEILIQPKVTTGEEAEGIIKANAYVESLMPKASLESLIILKEPIAFVIERKEGNPSKGMVIRDLRDLGRSSAHTQAFYYIPGFSLFATESLAPLKQIVSDSLGKKVADISNDDINHFIVNHYFIPAGKAMAELLAYFGLNMHSLHGQQILLQINSKGIPTGKIVLRDFIDAKLFKKLVPRTDATKILECTSCFLEDKNPNILYLMNLADYSGTHSWVDKTEQANWRLAYRNAFNSTFSAITGVPSESVEGRIKLLGEIEDKNGNLYATDQWNEYLDKFLQKR